MIHPLGQGQGRPGDPGGDESEAWQRLRLAEANIESLQDVLLSQESLADKLTTALQASAQSQQELARVQQELAVAVRSAGWRGVARAGKRRAVRLLAARGSAVSPAEPAPPVADASASAAEEVAWTDIRYEDWIDLYDTVDDETRRALVAQVAEIPDPPLISVIFPVYNSPEEFLRQAIDSVRAQLYTKWELCIADDCSTLPHVAKVLDEYAALDERIRVHRRPANGHISACSNSAVALATGSWLGLMDHDDVLAEHALAVCALTLQRHPEAAIVYSDEDHIEADGSRSQPYFKPDFDPLLILGQNYFSHLSLARADLVELVGGFREGYEGSQDWDLLLRVLEHVRPDQVVHIPHVLYHWRVHSESTASAVSAKPYVVDASRRVVEEHLKRIGVDATVTTVWDTSYRSEATRAGHVEQPGEQHQPPRPGGGDPGQPGTSPDAAGGCRRRRGLFRGLGAPGAGAAPVRPPTARPASLPRRRRPSNQLPWGVYPRRARAPLFWGGFGGVVPPGDT